MKHIFYVLDEIDRSSLLEDLALIRTAKDVGYTITTVMSDENRGIRNLIDDSIPFISLVDRRLPFSPTCSNWEKRVRFKLAGISFRHHHSFHTSSRSFSRLLQDSRPDFVFINSTNMLACAHAASRIGIPAAIRVNERLAVGFAGLKRRWLRYQIDRHSVRIIARTNIDANQLLQSRRIRILHEGVLPELIDNFPEASLEPVIMPPLIAYIPNQNRDDYQLIWDQLAYRFPSRQMAVISQGVDADFNHQFADISCEPVNVRITGCLADKNNKVIISSQQIPLAAILKKVDLIIIPEITRTNSQVLLTAAYLRIPAVTFDHALAREFIIDGVNGCLVAGGTIENLTALTGTLLDDPEHLSKLGTHARERVKVKHNRDVNARTLLAIFQEIL